MNELDDAVLVNECLQGSLQAFETLVDRYQKVIFNLAYRICNDYYDAEDVTQNVFIKVYENLKKYNDRYKFFSWLYRIAVNEALNMVKLKKNNEHLNERQPENCPAPDERYQRTETDQLIQDALMNLKTEYRLVLILKHMQNLSYQEIAQTLNISQKIVKSRLYTARQLLGQILTKCGVIDNG